MGENRAIMLTVFQDGANFWCYQFTAPGQLRPSQAGGFASKAEATEAAELHLALFDVSIHLAEKADGWSFVLSDKYGIPLDRGEGYAREALACAAGQAAAARFFEAIV